MSDQPKQSAFWKPKFLQAAFAQVSGLYLVTHGFIDGALYFQLTSVSLAIYSGATVYENKVMKP